MPSSITDILDQVRPTTSALKLYLSGDLMADLDLAEDELADYTEWKSESLSDVDPRVEIKERIADLQARIRSGPSATFRFQALPDKAWSDLRAAHPGRENRDESYNPDSMAVPMIAASCVDPVMTEDQTQQLFDKLNQHQRQQLFGGAFAANMRGVDVPFSRPPSAATPT